MYKMEDMQGVWENREFSRNLVSLEKSVKSRAIFTQISIGQEK